MIIENPYEGRKESEVLEIKRILAEDIPKKTEDRNFGYGETWSLEREKELQDWLDNISNKYNFDFRLLYANVESLYPDDYLIPTIYN